MKSGEAQPGRLKVTIERQAIRIGERFSVSFQRTLRIPDDGRIYPLPPGLGVFPVFAVRDFIDRVGPDMREEGGAFIPMYQREALWLGFDAAAWKPNAVKIAIGRINALSGQPYDHRLHADPQDYLICPEQPWLDGINSGPGTIRQFVAMPLGEGYTIEASLSEAEQFGGIQITVYEPKAGKFPDRPPPEGPAGRVPFARPSPSAAAQTMGLGAGGTMKQKIYSDPYGIDTWDQNNYGRVTVHIVNSEQFRQLTGFDPPPTPVSVKTYTELGLPWFDLYDEAKEHLAPPDRLREIKTIADRDKEKGEVATGDEAVDVPETQIIKLHPGGPGPRDRQPSAPGSARPKPKGK
jgi:hypothetical protein